MKENDIIQSFIFEHANIRGYIINIKQTYQTIINQRQYPPTVQKLLGEAMVSCIFLAANMKFEGKLSLQFQGDERLPLLVVQCDNQLNIRAMAKHADSLSSEEYERAFLNGNLSLTLHTPNQSNSYQSIVPINSSSISENFMQYLTHSEQITNQVWLAASENQVAGIMLQLMPDTNTQQQEQFWEYALAMGETVKPEELLSLDNEILLHRLYHETELRLFDSRPICFQCGCNDDKMKNVILMLGEKETNKVLQEQGKIEISCDFCNREYKFDAIDTAALFHPNSIKSGRYIDSDVEILKEIKSPKDVKKT